MLKNSIIKQFSKQLSSWVSLRLPLKVAVKHFLFLIPWIERVSLLEERRNDKLYLLYKSLYRHDALEHWGRICCLRETSILKTMTGGLWKIQDMTGLLINKSKKILCVCEYLEQTVVCFTKYAIHKLLNWGGWNDKQALKILCFTKERNS